MTGIREQLYSFFKDEKFCMKRAADFLKKNDAVVCGALDMIDLWMKFSRLVDSKFRNYGLSEDSSASSKVPPALSPHSDQQCRFLRSLVEDTTEQFGISEMNRLNAMRDAWMHEAFEQCKSDLKRKNKDSFGYFYHKLQGRISDNWRSSLYYRSRWYGRAGLEEPLRFDPVKIFSESFIYRLAPPAGMLTCHLMNRKGLIREGIKRTLDYVQEAVEKKVGSSDAVFWLKQYAYWLQRYYVLRAYVSQDEREDGSRQSDGLQGGGEHSQFEEQEVMAEVWGYLKENLDRRCWLLFQLFVQKKHLDEMVKVMSRNGVRWSKQNFYYYVKHYIAPAVETKLKEVTGGDTMSYKDFLKRCRAEYIRMKPGI